MKNPAYLAPTPLTIFWHKRDYNKKFKAYDITVGEEVTPMPIMPFGGNGRDEDDIYPVPFVEKMTRTHYHVRYFGVGMGDGPWKRTFFRTAAAARAAALEWLGDRREMTEAEKAEAAKDVKHREVKEKKERLARLRKEVANLEKELDEGVNPVNLAHGR
jgi:hypothetical protein